MRLWTLHPQYLDAKGLVALWREALLAQKVLMGQTRGYRNHPQLERFKAAPQPDAAIGAYLRGLVQEARLRGYSFDGSRILRPDAVAVIPATTGQMACEWEHLLAKLRVRAPDMAASHASVTRPRPHALFVVTEGPVADWERAEAGRK